jgi:TDG/mug DNA glycosylase family protein
MHGSAISRWKQSIVTSVLMDSDTVAIYEQHAAGWQERRGPRPGDEAQAFAARCRPGSPRGDLGCGPGRFTTGLGEPVVGLDAARAMLDLTRVAAPGAWLLQADIEVLPFRNGALGGAWAIASYVHVARHRLPLALAHLHWALSPGAPIRLGMFVGEYEGSALPDDDFPGRFFAQWTPDALRDVVVGAGFDVSRCDSEDGRRLVVEAVRARSLPDTVGRDMRLLVCGLNPSLYAADAGVGFARPGNRFWPAARAAGLVTSARDPRAALRDHGIGMTDLVKRATVAAKELTRDEYRAGLARVERLAAWLKPGAVCFVGLDGWRAAVDRSARAGWQPDGVGGAPAYVMPSTSGLNARTSTAELTDHLRDASLRPR